MKKVKDHTRKKAKDYEDNVYGNVEESNLAISMETEEIIMDNCNKRDVYMNMHRLKGGKPDKSVTAVSTSNTKFLATLIILIILFLILSIITGLLFRHYLAINKEMSELKNHDLAINEEMSQLKNHDLAINKEISQLQNQISKTETKKNVSELWKSVSNIMGDLSKLKDKVDLAEGSCTTCPPGWNLIRANCYFFSLTNEKWERSKEICAEKNGILITFKNKIEMLSLIKTINKNRYWLGLKRDPKDIDTWLWVDGSPLTFSAWNEGEPNNDRNNEHCAEIMGGVQLWNDLSCDRSQQFICKGVWSC
ncbi:CD209 antigen-like protein 2 [Anomaloglossus baeobatrachus]